MIKKLLPGLVLVAICSLAFFSCKKANKNTADITRDYFPLKYGHYVTYAVDSIYYDSHLCTQTEKKSQLRYMVTDTFTDHKTKQISYILDVSSRPYAGAYWTPIRVITITPTTNSLLYSQDNVQYVKLMFPIQEGFTWKGNVNANTALPELAYLKNWDYTYQNVGKSYFNGEVNFDHTVTVLEDDESVNYPSIDSGVSAYRTYAKEVYGYNIGMVYKEWTHTTYSPSTPQCLDGYTVIMQAIEYN